MWESLLKQNKIQKAGKRTNYKMYRDALRTAAFTVMENKPAGTEFAAKDLILMEEEITEIAKTLVPARLLGGFAQFRKNKFDGQMIVAARMMVANGMAEKLETSRVGYKLTGQMRKSKDYGKSPKKISPEMEEDIEEVVADNEFENNPTLSDKVKHILMEGRKSNKPARTQEEMDEFKRKYPNVDKAEGGCGCGCDGEDVSKASSQCTKRTKKASSTRKGKKWMACVPNGKGGYKRVHWGQRGVSVTGKRGNTKRKKSFRARHKCSTCKGGDYSARCMACRDW